MLKITMKFYWGCKYKRPSKRRRDKLRKERFLAQFRSDPVLVPVPFLEPGQSPHPVSLGQLVCTAVATALIMQAKKVVGKMVGCTISRTAWPRRLRKLRRSKTRSIIGLVMF